MREVRVGSGAHATLSRLTEDEAEFIDAAAERILPEAGDRLRRGAASIYVDAKLVALTQRCEERGEGGGCAAPTVLYRAGIAAAQARCLLAHGQRFQRLAVWHQLAVLAALEECDRGDAIGRRFLFTLVNDAAEAYFDVAGDRANASELASLHR
jgi:hypothetical protein